MTEEFRVAVPAYTGEEERVATVYLPKQYGGGARFPVLYMFDGQTAFFDERAPYGASWRMGETLDRLNVPLIVAAVDCDKVNRLTEYSPFPFSTPFGSSEGKGDVYLKWLTERFKPLIDEKYPTLPAREHTYLAGSSMGGLMTVYALCRYPEVFAGGAALSPSFWVAPEKCAEEIVSARWRPKTALYLDYGVKELKNHGKEQREGLSRCLDALTARGVPFTFRLIDGGVHSETSWREQVPDFLRALHLL